MGNNGTLAIIKSSNSITNLPSPANLYMFNVNNSNSDGSDDRVISSTSINNGNNNNNNNNSIKNSMKSMSMSMSDSDHYINSSNSINNNYAITHI
jgi:hypothetical protein